MGNKDLASEESAVTYTGRKSRRTLQLVQRGPGSCETKRGFGKLASAVASRAAPAGGAGIGGREVRGPASRAPNETGRPSSAHTERWGPEAHRPQ